MGNNSERSSDGEQVLDRKRFDPLELTSGHTAFSSVFSESDDEVYSDNLDGHLKTDLYGSNEIFVRKNRRMLVGDKLCTEKFCISAHEELYDRRKQ